MNPARTYLVPLTPREVLLRLRGAIDPESFLSDLEWGGSTHSFYGWVGEREFAVKVRTSVGGSIKRVLEGRVDPDSGGSLIRVQVAMNRYSRSFMKFWLGITAIFQVRNLQLLDFGARDARPTGEWEWGII